MPSARALFHIGARLSSWQVGEEEVNSKDIKVVYSEDPDVNESEGAHGADVVKPELLESHLGNGILLKNPRLKVIGDELKKLRYLYKIPQSVSICAPEAHERVDWVVHG